MTQLEKLLYLNKILLEESPIYQEQAKQFTNTKQEQYQLFRSLLNLRSPGGVSEAFLKVQDEFLQQEMDEKGVVTLQQLEPIEPDIYLWKGDITRLAVDGIVNAANDALLGCFVPCHGCIDNAIHSAAGIQLREECNQLMQQQGHREQTGIAKITPAYNLPSNYVLHTVGPIIYGELTEKDCELLRSCYRACLELALENQLQSIAFCCISTGEFHFPNDKASEIAVTTVKEILSNTNHKIKVVFNVFKEIDYRLYKELLG
ncbi:MAG: protein-ADP-ribose hydrolase [Eubacteriales bacterium]